MILQHRCPECGEYENIDVEITVYLNANDDPRDIVITSNCLNCRQEWQSVIHDFKIDIAN